MPADRLITVNAQALGSRNEQGVFVPGATTVYRVWASKRDVTLEDVLESGGNRGVTERRWRIRYNGAIYLSSIELMTVEDGLQTFEVTNLQEITAQRDSADLRRRFMEISGVVST